METKSELINKTVIARIERAGVFMGVLDYIDGDIVRLKDVRRIYYWEGALSVTDMAVNGIRRGRVTVAVGVAEFNRGELIEINECTEKAVERFKAIAPWRA